MLTTDASENPRLCEHQERSSLFINILILGSTHRREMREDLGVLVSIILVLICTELIIVRIYLRIEKNVHNFNMYWYYIAYCNKQIFFTSKRQL